MGRASLLVNTLFNLRHIVDTENTVGYHFPSCVSVSKNYTGTALAWQFHSQPPYDFDTRGS